MRKWLTQLICSHKNSQKFIRNNYGEKIGCSNSSTWECTDCKKIIYDPEICTMGIINRDGTTDKKDGIVYRIYHNHEWHIKGMYFLDTSQYDGEPNIQYANEKDGCSNRTKD